MKKSNKKFYEEKIIREMLEMDKALKKSTRKSLKRGLLATLPILAIPASIFLPQSLFITFLIISMGSLAFAKVKFDKEDFKEEQEIHNQIDNFGENLNADIENMHAKETNYNRLLNPIDYSNFTEEILVKINYLIEQDVLITNKIKVKSLNLKSIKEFLYDIKNTLGNDVKIIPTVDFENNFIFKSLGLNDNLRPITYLYSSDNFYIYFKKNDTFILLPIVAEEVYKMFSSNKDNYNNQLLVQFMEEKFGPLDFENNFRL